MLPAGPPSRYLKVCAIIAALALTTFSLPFLIGALGTHSFILLSSKGAIELVLIHLLTKVATYALFKTVIFFKDRFFFNFPKNTDEVNSLETPALLQIKEHLTSYPGNGHYISLPVQLGLNKKLIESGQESLPLISFSELGKEWSREDLKTLHSQDLSQLPLHKKAAIAELFMHHHFPPQMRPYTRDEVPGIESITKKKKLSQARAQWVYLILRLNPTAPLSATINEQLYQKGLPPPRRDSIDLPIPVNQKSIENLKEVQIPWYFNLFSEKSNIWNSLPLSLQSAFNKRFSEKLCFTALAGSDKPWIPEGLTWKLVALAALIRATVYVVKSSFTDSEIPVPQKTRLIGTSLKLYETASRASASFVKETFTIPDWVKSFVVNRVENLAQPVLQASKIPAPSALIPFVPFNYPENFISSIVEPIKEIATKTISLPPTQNALVASITAAPSSSTNLYALALLSLGALGALYAIYKCSKSQIDQPNEDDLRALEPLPKKEQLQVSVPIGPKSSFVGVEYGDKNNRVQTLIDITNPRVQEFYQVLQQSNPQLPVNLDELAGQVVRLNNPRIIREFEALNPPQHVALLEEAPPQEVQMIEVEADPRIEPNWEAFEDYVERNCSDVDVQTAKRLATEGIILIQRLMKNEPVEVTNLDDQLVAACWGLMLHAITKDQAFVEGTIDIKDPEYRIFNFFFPALYGRSSSHYKKRAIPIENGKWRDYKHFGADLSKLPAKKRTVMLGKIATLDGSHRTYIKMENWGANLNLRSDPNALRNFYQVIFHSLEFFESAAKKAAPSVFGEVGGGLNMKKEHMLQKDADEIARLIKQILAEDQNFTPPKEIDDFGFQVIIPYFKKALQEGKISGDLRTHIEDYLNRIQDRYGNNRYQKGNEASIGDSILFMNPAHSNIPAERVELEEDDFEEMKITNSIELPKDWETASRNFLSDDYLLSGTVRTYADYLKETGSKFSFVPEFLYPAVIESNVNRESVIEGIFNLPSEQDQANHPIFIPFILESNARRLRWIGSYFPDHIVILVLDPKTKTYEYYNSQGGALADETRNVLGVNMPANELLKRFKFENWQPKHNTHVHQKDYTNCGAFISWFMKKRMKDKFEDICQNQNIDIRRERSELASDLSRFYDPQNNEIKPTCIADLGSNHGKIQERSVKEMIQEDIQRYLIKEGQIDSARLFTELNENRQAHIIVNREKPQDAGEIFHTLAKTGRKANEVLALMTLLRPTIFNSVNENIWRELNTIGEDQSFKIQNSGNYDFYIETEEENIRIFCSTSYTVTDKSGATVTLNANVLIDTKENKVIERWNIPE